MHTSLSEFVRRMHGSDVQNIRTYADDRNPVSQNLIAKIGFRVLGRVGNGRQYIIDKDSFIDRLCLLRSSHVMGPNSRMETYP